MCRSACLSNSPTSNTTEVVPSPVMSSCAVAARAIMTLYHQPPAVNITEEERAYSRWILYLLFIASAWLSPHELRSIHTISRSSTFPSFVSLIYRSLLGWVVAESSSRCVPVPPHPPACEIQRVFQQSRKAWPTS